MSEKYRSSADLRKEISASESDARRFISCLFDEGTFLEIGTYTRSSGKDSCFEGVVTGCGAVDGRLVFAFIQDYSNVKGAFTSVSAKKIEDLYTKAVRAEAPVIGIYKSAGAVLDEGIGAVSGYGSVIAKMAEAKSVIPQISVIEGACGGALAVCASMADFVIADKKSGDLYIMPEYDEKMKKGVKADLYADGCEDLAAEARQLLSYLPLNSTEGTVYTVEPDDINVPSQGIEELISDESDVRDLIRAVSDGGKFFEIGSEEAGEMVCGFAAVNGTVVCAEANQPTVKDGALTEDAARKAAAFTDFAGRFGIPVLSFVNTPGFGGEESASYAGALAGLCRAYSGCGSCKVTVITGKAYGSAFTVFGSKRLGADMVFALDSAVVSIMPPEAAVEFIYDDKIRKAQDPDAERAALKENWIKEDASPLAAAKLGDIDDIIDYSEIRQRIAAALETF